MTSVRVVCRFRPENQKEKDLGGGSIVSVDETGTTVSIKGSETQPHKFTFDRVFINASQREVYEYTALPVVEDILKGYNGTIFVYGQTSSGKTHTMQGPNIEDQELKGIIPRMNGTIFDSILRADPNIEFLVKAQYIEIYMEKIRDLLDSSKSNLKVREEKSKGIWVEGATEMYVSSVEDVIEVIQTGFNNRAIAETKMNSESSRSHSIFILSVNQKNLNDLSNKTGKMYLVDLAGSEKVEKTGAQGSTLDEAKMINKSLSALGNVINALTDGKSQHVPYRDSKLTRVLQESLGGNSRTTLIINCSPSAFNEAETLSTLRFGNRAKNIKNQAKINAERSVGELKLLLAKSEKEIERLQGTISILQEEVAIYQSGGNPIPKPAIPGSAAAEAAPVVGITPLQEKCIELENKVRKLEEEKQALSDIHENIVEELKDKEQEIEVVEALKEELSNLKAMEETLSKENEMLIVKLADITIENERLNYESSESKIQVENLAAQNSALSQELSDLKLKVDSLNAQKSKSSKLFEEGDSREKIEEIEVALAENKESLSDSKGAILNAKAESELLTALRIEIESQKNQIDFLKKERDLQEVTMKRLRGDIEQQITQKTDESVQGDSKDANQTGENRLERELQLVREQTSQKLLEFDALKTALLRDLENRCQKVIELEMLLDEAREQYQTLLVQVKNSNSKTLQQKCVFLQRNLEQLTAVQQQLVNENNRLKLENQVCVKQLAIRNERIHGLELLLQDAQEKLQKQITSNEAELREKSASFKRGVTVNSATRKPGTITPSNNQGGRIAKPIRGGGKAAEENGAPNSSSLTTPPGSVSSPGERRTSSIWDIFRSGKKPEDSQNARVGLRYGLV
eukprot:TRINITY_DN1613_c0_g1_i3.p1 TRINITY_DN1613_c0_g1~~TRINITY_DN1613_c0_g1_i3.p1  ORF type:complete len:862 (-),score=280.43 TRINITY_DN1613_c0_g1_i3:83-2668(-)